MKKMYIEDAVKYCLNHKAVIHTPTKDIYNSLMSYLESKHDTWHSGASLSDTNWYTKYKADTCICINDDGSIRYSDAEWYKSYCYEIIKLTSVSIDGISYSNKDKAISKIESIFSSFPSAGDTYYFINSFGAVIDTTWSDRATDNPRLAVGNVYKTRELASIALDRVIKAYKG